MVPKKSRWSPPFGTCVALKISKDRLKAKKLHPPEIRGSFLQKNSIE
jgi:hypothetical protein